jgi:hypothetical protein
MKRTYRVDDSEIATRKRLRPLFTKLKEIAESVSDADTGNVTGLSQFMKENGFEYGDLVALRDRPHHWDMHHALKWEWYLRRAMNHFSQTLKG